MSSFKEKHVWRVLEAYYKTNSVSQHQIDSFNDFVNFGMQEIVDQESTLSVGNYSIKFGQISLAPPQVIEEDRSLCSVYPMNARRRDLNYDSAIHCDISEKYIEADGTEDIKHHNRVVIGRMPVMLKSCVCNLSKLTPDEQVQAGECPNDPGGYFVIKGNERVLVAQMRANYNQVFVLKQKPGDKYRYIGEVRSMSTETGHSVLIQAMVGQDDRTVLFSLPYIKEPIPAGVVFKALGFLEDEEISDLLALPENKYIKYILRDSFFCKTKEEALQHIGQYAMHIISEDKKEAYAWQVVETELLPHLGITGTVKEQACFLANIIRKLILTNCGYRNEDDRDNYANKRVESAGQLMYEIFRNLFKKYTQFIKLQLDRKGRPDILSIVSRIKSITKGLHQCLATGNWGVQKNASYMRTGVSQILDRMTYCATLSHLRRVIIPVGKEGKNTAMRQLHGSSIFYCCPSETPEGQKIGIVLNLALLAKVSKKVSTVEVRGVLDKVKSITKVDDMDTALIKDSTIVFLNNIIIGFTQDPEKTVRDVRRLREKGILDHEVSVSYDSVDNNVSIYCDEGRFIRPLFTLENNTLKIQGEKKYKWRKLLKEGYVQYLDPSEIESCVLAMYPKMLEKQHSDYCEIHPCTMYGIMASMIPFPDHSQSPRNCYQCLDENEEIFMGDGTLKRIGDVRVGDEVITVDPKTCEQSITKVINQYVKDTEKNIVKIKTISGRELVCTDDHPILTYNGWRKAGNLGNQDLVCIFPNHQEDNVYYEFLLSLGNYYKSYNDWCDIIKQKGDAIFVPVSSVTQHPRVRIADITTESENHSFITSSGICVHNSSMGKQALGVPALSYNLRTDTCLHVLHYAQKPLVTTKPAEIIGINDMPSGINAIVAIACYSG
jgi:DNA-directed RNA polymerase II subunit RPB2